MESNKELIDYLIKKGVLKSQSIIKSFLKIDRKDFVISETENLAYFDVPLTIGNGQTISQPSTVGIMLELLNPKRGNIILDIGSGSGWTSALLGKIVGKKGLVIGVERIEKLVNFGKNNIKKYKLNNINIIKAGKKLGIESQQFDRILVSASSEKLPIELIDQLVDGGIMIIPIKESILKITKKSDKQYYSEEYPGFVFVPLIK